MVRETIVTFIDIHAFPITRQLPVRADQSLRAHPCCQHRPALFQIHSH